ncbi:alpha/beta hydrolase [Asticcacaulis sp. SL142]|uniref:alpha/beta fold hydrolase n=1 Tax=Asticcacaulis sp. SL142 TaxID=2995155 RepID=UPI00226C7291|nr:alpha/beta hydrolase [Asticcacaulis sp. SL142]WAC48533.1 alpha/beta hydrolase [Asticcacaulis sp. SL142]
MVGLKNDPKIVNDPIKYRENMKNVTGKERWRGAMRSYKIRANNLDFTVDETGEGEDVMLLLHGFPQSRLAWTPLMSSLATTGWRIVAPDMRGYGDTERPSRLKDYRIEALTRDVVGLFDALKARRRIVIGHDWGGVIAWRTAIDHADKINGLVVINAPHPIVFDTLLKSGLKQRLRSLYVLFFLLPLLPEWHVTRRKGKGLMETLGRQSSAFSGEALAVYARNICQPGAATAMINYYRANMTRLVAPYMHKPLQVPVQMVWGMNDPFLDRALTDGNEALVADFTLASLEGISHWVLEEAPDRVVDAIHQWAREKGLL